VNLRRSYDELRKNLGRSYEELRKILRSFENRAPGQRIAFVILDINSLELPEVNIKVRVMFSVGAEG